MHPLKIKPTEAIFWILIPGNEGTWIISMWTWNIEREKLGFRWRRLDEMSSRSRAAYVKIISPFLLWILGLSLSPFSPFSDFSLTLDRIEKIIFFLFPFSKNWVTGGVTFPVTQVGRRWVDCHPGSSSSLPAWVDLQLHFTCGLF